MIVGGIRYQPIEPVKYDEDAVPSLQTSGCLDNLLEDTVNRLAQGKLLGKSGYVLEVPLQERAFTPVWYLFSYFDLPDQRSANPLSVP